MQDKDFDQFIRNAAEQFPAPEYNPADWDRLEDQLHNLNLPQAQPSLNPLKKFSLGKAAMVASAVVVTAVNAVLFVKSDSGNNSQPTQTENAISRNENPETPTGNTLTEVNTVPLESKNTLQTAEITENDVVSSGENSPESNLANAEVSEYSLAASQNKSAQISGLNSNAANKTVGKTGKNAVRNTNEPGKNSGINSSLWYGGNMYTGGNSGSRSNHVSGGSQPIAGSNTAATGCAGNHVPEVAFAVVNSDTIYGSRIALSGCKPAVIKFVTHDKDADQLTITSNIAEMIPGATVALSKSSQPTLALNLPATLVARQQPYAFTIWLHDNRCPNTSPRPFAFSVSITPAFTIAVNGITSIEKGQYTMLEAVGAPEGSSFKWSSKFLAGSMRSAKISVNPAETATYAVQVTAPGGCSYTDSVKVTVAKEQPGDDIIKIKNIPNIFTPNGDGSNDYFEVKLPEDGPYSLVVFDRWSKKVYSSQKYQNNWEAENLPVGTYYYVITTHDKKTYKGWVEVVR